MVFCIFAMLTFSVLMLGAGAYRNIELTSREGANEQIGLSYIWTRVKNSDDADMVYVRDFNGLPALFLGEEYGETLYQTIIYYHNGWIYEVFTDAGNSFKPGDGTRIVETETLWFEEHEEAQIKVVCGDESVFISLRGNKGVPRPGGGR